MYSRHTQHRLIVKLFGKNKTKETSSLFKITPPPPIGKKIWKISLACHQEKEIINAVSMMNIQQVNSSYKIIFTVYNIFFCNFFIYKFIYEQVSYLYISIYLQKLTLFIIHVGSFQHQRWSVVAFFFEDQSAMRNICK